MRPSSPWRTPSRMSPQNFAVGRPIEPSFSFEVDGEAVDSSRAKLTVDLPPMSASHPVANCWMSSWVLKLKSVMGAREGSSAPDIRKTVGMPQGQSRSETSTSPCVRTARRVVPKQLTAPIKVARQP